MDMSMVCGFVGVPATLTRPLTAPFSGLADEIVNVVKIAATTIVTFLACMDRFLLFFMK
jgi:hypothetical protein